MYWQGVDLLSLQDAPTQNVSHQDAFTQTAHTLLWWGCALRLCHRIRLWTLSSFAAKSSLHYASLLTKVPYGTIHTVYQMDLYYLYTIHKVPSYQLRNFYFPEIIKSLLKMKIDKT